MKIYWAIISHALPRTIMNRGIDWKTSSPDLIMPKYSPKFVDCFRKNQEDRQQSLEQWILAYYQKCLKLICRSRHRVDKYHSDLLLSPEFGIQEVFELSSILLPQWLKYRCNHVNIIPLDVKDLRTSKYKFLWQGTVLGYFTHQCCNQRKNRRNTLSKE